MRSYWNRIIAVQVTKWIILAMAAGLAFFWGCRGNGKDAAAIMQKGVESFQAGHYAAAESAYRRVIALEPENAAAYNLLGMACRFRYNKSGDPVMRRRETEAFRRAVALNPRFLAAVKNLAATLYRDGDMEGAAGMARRALEINPDDPEKEVLTAWVLQAQSDEE